MLRPPPSSPLFPYTTLFRSRPTDRRRRSAGRPAEGHRHDRRRRRHRVGGSLRQYQRDLQYQRDRKSTRLNSSHVAISYAVFCLKKKKKKKKKYKTPDINKIC